MSKKILILSEKPLDDYSVWSGSMYNMNQALLDQGFETEWLPTPTYTARHERLFRRVEKTYNRIFNRGFNRMHFLTKAWISARLLKKEIEKREFDLLFAPISAGLIPFLNIRQPIIYLNDANAAQLFNYNIMFSGFGLISKKITMILEKKTMQRAAANVFSNIWGAAYAIGQYGIPEQKVHTVRFGANMPAPEKYSPKEGFEPLRILFIAARWELKGGDIAYAAYKILKERGKAVEFTVVGCTPDLRDNTVTIIPFIDKNTSEGLQQLKQIFTQHHILLLPTKNDCSPIVMCEAAAYGLSVVSTKTGGVHEIVVDGQTGYTLPMEATPEDYAETIEQLIADPELLQQMSHNARKRYEEVLNWDMWGQKMKEIIEKL